MSIDISIVNVTSSNPFVTMPRPNTSNLGTYHNRTTIKGSALNLATEGTDLDTF